MYITPFYAAILALLFFVLSVRTLRVRRRLQIPIGDAGNPEMLRAMRVHSNFAEYVPISLLMVFLFESISAVPAFIHVLCICLVLGRIAHAFGVSQSQEDYRYRVFGMTMTFTALVGAGIGLLVLYVLRLLS